VVVVGGLVVVVVGPVVVVVGGLVVVVVGGPVVVVVGPVVVVVGGLVVVVVVGPVVVVVGGLVVVVVGGPVVVVVGLVVVVVGETHSGVSTVAPLTFRAQTWPEEASRRPRSRSTKPTTVSARPMRRIPCRNPLVLVPVAMTTLLYRSLLASASWRRSSRVEGHISGLVPSGDSS
jgi:hypothetical protein